MLVTRVGAFSSTEDRNARDVSQLYSLRHVYYGCIRLGRLRAFNTYVLTYIDIKNDTANAAYVTERSLEEHALSAGIGVTAIYKIAPALILMLYIIYYSFHNSAAQHTAQKRNKL